MKLLKSNKASYSRFRFLTIVGLTTFVLLFNDLIGRQRGDTELKGETSKVAAVPKKTVDAGEIHLKADTDHDGIPDEDEVRYGLNPNDPTDADGDNDGDGLSNGDEIAMGLNPNSADTDGDGFSDAEEVRLGFNPLDPASHPQPGAPIVSIRVTPHAMALNLNSLLGSTPEQLTVTGVLSDGTTVDLTRATSTHYQSLDTSVVLVDGLGSVAGVLPGSTSITVSNGAFSAQTAVIIAETTVGQLAQIGFNGGTAGRVDVSGAYAYVADGSAGLRIVDVNDHDNPFLASTFDTPGDAKGVKVIGNLVYIADGLSGLQIVDVTNPSNPILAGSIDTPGDAQDVAVYGMRAYVADGLSGLQIIDVADSHAPVLLGSLSTTGTTRGVDVSGNFAVLAMGTDGIRVVNVSNPASPSGVGALATSFASDVRTEGNIAYIADSGLKVVDISTPSSPQVISSLPNFTSGDLLDLVKVENFVFGADTFSFRTAVPVIDVINPAAAVVRGYVSFNDFARSSGVAADQRFVYVSTPLNNLYIGQYFRPDDVTDISPTISITSPQNGQTFMEGSALNITADAADDVLVKSVSFTIDGQVISADTAPPYRDTTHTVPLNVTSVTIAATAADQAGNVGTSAPITLNVIPDPPPSIQITSPPAGITQIGTSVTMSAIASDNIAVERVELRVNGTLMFTFHNQTYSFPFSPTPDVTSLNIEFTAFDNLGRSTTAVRTVPFVYDRLPEIFLQLPGDGAGLHGGFDHLILADITDDVAVAHVEFNLLKPDSEEVAAVLGSFTAPPYRALWPIAYNDSGRKVLTIVATDNLGASKILYFTVIVIPDAAPVISITSPADGTQLIEGQLFTAVADAHDDRQVTQVKFALNGVDSLPVTQAPFSRVLTVPNGINSLTLLATATDNFGQSTGTTKSYTILFNQPPVVALTSPAQGAQIYGGQTVTLAADAGDDYGIQAVTFRANGVDVGSATAPPYTGSFVIPGGATTLIVQATALDIYGKSTSASRTLPVLDPLTTVAGRVTDLQGNSIAGASVTLDNSGGRTTVTDAQGSFSFSGVATIPAGVRWSVTIIDTATGRQGHSALLPPVLAGTTDLGIILLSSEATTPLPATPSAYGKGDYTGDSVDDLFVGFADRQSRGYISNALGQFLQSTNLTLPFGAVRSGTGADMNNDGKGDILAQPIGQVGNITVVLTDGFGGILSTSLLATGLGHEAEAIATGLDDVNSPAGPSQRVRPEFLTPPVRRRVVAFLSVTGGTTLTVRFTDDFGGFLPPVSLAVDPAAQLRSLRLVDVTGDHLVDLVLIKQTSATAGSIVVYPRVSGTSFGAPIESPVALRNVSATTTTEDCVIGDFDGDSTRDAAVLGDDRVRIYRGNGAGGFTLLSDVTLPAGVTPSAISVPYSSAASGEDLIVVARDSVSLDHKLVLLYENTGFPGNASFTQPARLDYTIPGAIGDSRLLIGHFGGDAFIEDVVVIDGETVTAFLDVVR